MRARIGPFTGIACWLIVFTGFFIHGYPNLGASPQELVDWASNTDPNRFGIGIYVEDVGILVFLFFLGWLCQTLWRAGGTAWLLGLALASGVAWAAVSLGVNGVWTAVLDSGRRGLDPQTLAGIRDIAQEMYNSTNLVIGTAMVALGLATLAAVGVPRWLGWAAIAIGVGAALPYVGAQFAYLLVIWSVAVAIRYLIRPAPLQATSPPLPI
jgi:hypothetical protein